MEHEFNEAADQPVLRATDHDGIAVVEIAGELDMKTAKTALAEVLLVLDQSPNGIVVDLHAVTFFGSAGVSLLVSVQQEAGRQGVPFGIVAVHKAVTRSLTVSGMESRLPLFPTVADAVIALRAASPPPRR
ncbi:STAS domain-containing protein [Lentzea sp. NBRC 102530]|uniref:STAS domain-containing protein n=1 Tax=Lentzea sp. NBRC 102530 TaxID=3032201 RepID=UPI0024A39E6B|nr:STAS domain-containing protein [Lentzea sp. NBRC 102530]GLY49896.1 anti-sigma factor antagonist [Lentzea sp. NBRC 102530]